MMQEKLLEILRKVNKAIPDDPTVNLLANHLLDSFDMVNLVTDIEEEFSIELDPEDILPENFASLQKIQELVEKYKG